MALETGEDGDYQNRDAQDTLSASDINSAGQGVAASDTATLTRRNLLALGAATCGAIVLLAARPGHADILDTLNKVLHLDPIVLNYAHEMEELECDFFSRALRSAAYNQLESRERSVFNLIEQQDRAHFEALEAERMRRGVRGGDRFETPNASASRRPRVFKFPARAFNSRENLLRESIEIKESVLFAYHGAVDLVSDPKLLAAAAAIAGVEGRHVMALRYMAGLDPVPTSFEGQVSPQKIGDRLARYGFKGGGMRGGSL